MSEIIAAKNLVARCGLYCGACGKYLRGKCPGCAKNEKATWCAIRKCTAEHSWATCAECTEYSKVNECGKYNNFIAKVFGLIFRSNRAACIERIKAVGLDGFAVEMAAAKRQSLPRA
jgi:hypothetical protein